ncbi:MAG: type II secretion system protein GspG, partial [Candidatus Levyibacteriota bacterium]
TLVELLIVISIIGVLTTLLMANFIGVRQRARDGQRKSDLRQLQSALELYRSDQGSYPVLIPNCSSSVKSPDCSTSTYMQNVPADPMGPSYYNGGNYYFLSNGTTYTLGSCLENSSDSQGTSTSPGGSGCPSNFYYVLNNP